jgi:hypothetical protein
MALGASWAQIAGMRKVSTATWVAGLAPWLLSGLPAFAQNAPDGQWHFLAQPYAMFPNMKGETGIADLPAVPVDEDPQDIFDHLQMGAMLYLEARNDQWTFSSDLLYMDLGADIGGGDPPTLVNGEVDVSQVGWELAAMRRLTPWFELGLGLTYNQVDVDTDLTFNLPIVGPTDRSGGLEENWIDPTIVMRGTWPLNDKWFVQARANVGGFGVGSDLMWQVMADVGYRPSEKWSLSFGYRVIDIDYENGSGPDRFVYDMQTFGPQLKLGINF